VCVCVYVYLHAWRQKPSLNAQINAQRVCVCVANIPFFPWKGALMFWGTPKSSTPAYINFLFFLFFFKLMPGELASHRHRSHRGMRVVKTRFQRTHILRETRHVFAFAVTARGHFLYGILLFNKIYFIMNICVYVYVCACPCMCVCINGEGKVGRGEGGDLMCLQLVMRHSR